MLGLNTNVMASRNLYWSTLSALIAWPVRVGDQRDAIGFERSPSKSCPPAILPPQFSNTSTIRHVAKFQGSDLSHHICISLPSINQLWLENRSWVVLCWRGCKMRRNMTHNGIVMGGGKKTHFSCSFLFCLNGSRI